MCFEAEGRGAPVLSVAPVPVSQGRDAASGVVMDAATLLAQSPEGGKDEMHGGRPALLPFWTLQSQEDCIIP